MCIAESSTLHTQGQDPDCNTTTVMVICVCYLVCSVGGVSAPSCIMSQGEVDSDEGGTHLVAIEWMLSGSRLGVERE